LNLQLNGDFIRIYDQFFSIHPSFWDAKYSK
jgi:hypothetical protein